MDAYVYQDVVVEIKTDAMTLPSERAHGLCTSVLSTLSESTVLPASELTVNVI